jgi:hypothetical protein
VIALGIPNNRVGESGEGVAKSNRIVLVLVVVLVLDRMRACLTIVVAPPCIT